MPVPRKRLVRLTLIAALGVAATIVLVAIAIWQALRAPTNNADDGQLPVAQEAPSPRHGPSVRMEHRGS
ncbi:hypothetical protein [Intrasporangium sp. YIM S08009]|uniref:hypothetical protein n=1 Tax=Intrasporangium zincisolvens TaxID=3080018 RepID=UPI002B0590B2|nr:hypothetical protein [Intrasporangium sp. YIM S08009]